MDYVIDNWAKSVIFKQREEMRTYIAEYFTKEEAERHADNLMNMFPNEGSIAQLKLSVLCNQEEKPRWQE